jgi:hypothetical protein
MDIQGLRRKLKLAHSRYSAARHAAMTLAAELTDPDDTESRKGQRVVALWAKAEAAKAARDGVAEELFLAEEEERYSGYEPDMHDLAWQQFDLMQQQAAE